MAGELGYGVGEGSQVVAVRLWGDLSPPPSQADLTHLCISSSELQKDSSKLSMLSPLLLEAFLDSVIRSCSHSNCITGAVAVLDG